MTKFYRLNCFCWYLLPIPVGINENRHLAECNSNRKRKAITMGKNMQQYWIKPTQAQRNYYLHRNKLQQIDDRYSSSLAEVFFVKVVLKICSKFTGEHPYRSVISIKLLCNFIEITPRYGCSPVNLMHIFRSPFSKNTCGWLLLHIKLCEFPLDLTDT